ncbi:MAG: alpha/beta fold hydrolase [Alphaproteobacteria bacterium]
MAHFILVHGACHGAWCWRDVVPLVEAAGHSVAVIDLPSHGEDPTPIADVSLELYVDRVAQQVSDSDVPVVLVGHSAAGVTIAQVAERMPQAIAQLIYLCAYAPENGDSLIEMRKRSKRQPLLNAVQRAADGLSYTIDPNQAAGIFYHDCPDEVVDFALAKLGPQAIAPQATNVSLGTKYDSVKRVYILCEDDHTIPPEAQEEMVANWSADDIYRLNCGHSAFFVCPDRLVQMLIEISERPS